MAEGIDVVLGVETPGNPKKILYQSIRWGTSFTAKEEREGILPIVRHRNG